MTGNRELKQQGRQRPGHRHCKREFVSFFYIAFTPSCSISQILAIFFSGSNSQGPHLSSEKKGENVVLRLHPQKKPVKLEISRQ